MADKPGRTGAHAMKIEFLITGGNGQLGSILQDILGSRALSIDLPDLDISDRNQVRRIVSDLAPDCIINCAAVTDVDECQRNPELAFRVHREGVANLANTGKRLLTVSSDQVFTGSNEHNRPFTEDDDPQPANVYGLSKLQGERIALDADPNNVVVRTSWMFSRWSGMIPFIWKSLTECGMVKAVADQRACMTYAPDLARAIVRILDDHLRGLFHVVNRPGLTPLEMAGEVSRFTGGEIHPIAWKDLKLDAPRPVYSELDSNRDIGLPDFDDAFGRWRNSNVQC
jgi:dTDP-4-dehydrorhamnose reductase